MIRGLLVALLAGTAALADSGPKTVTVCVDSAESYPFSFQEKDEVQGIHVDVARDAIEAAGFRAAFKFLPWKRCIGHEVKNGASDSALSAAWSQERESYLWYPDDAKELGPKCRSASAVICNGPILLVPGASTYQFRGDVKTLPQPVRVTFGYAQAEEYRNLNLKVDEGPAAEFNVAKMVRDDTGSVLIWSLNLPEVERNPKFQGKFRVVAGFQDLSDGFLPFSKQGTFSQVEAQKIWSELKRRRAEPGYMERVLSRYPARKAGK